MSYYLFLDDNRKPKDVTWVELPLVEWVIIRDYKAFREVLKTRGLPDLISYDCDLCDEHYEAYFKHKHEYPLHYKEFKTPCGIHCIEFVLECCKILKNRPHPEYILHTMNHHAKPFMKSMIEKHNVSVV
jgi:hypothetical protein